MTEIDIISDELLDAIANDYISEQEVGDTLMMAALKDQDWPYIAGLIVMQKSYRELSDHPDIQSFIRKVCAKWGEDHTHEHWMSLDQPASLSTAADAIRRYNKWKAEGQDQSPADRG